MTIEHPRFPTPEDERRAALLYAAMRELADIDNAIPATGAPDVKEPTEALGQCNGALSVGDLSKDW